MIASTRQTPAAGHIQLTDLTGRQSAVICRVPESSLRDKRRQKRDRTPVLAKAWFGATSHQRLEFIRTVGVDEIWSALVDAS
jgi:hypothetical protein